MQAKPPAYPCLIIDHDDTTVMSTPTIHYPAHVEALKRLRPGRKPIDLEGWLKKNFHPGFRPYLEEELGWSPSEVEAAYRVWRDYTNERIPSFFPGLFSILREYRRRGGLLVVVSHSDVDLIERDYRAASAEAGPAEGLFPDLVFGWTEDPARRKPDPYPVLETMKRFALRPEDILVLDDLKPGADMAAAAGVACAAAGWGYDVPEIREAMLASCVRYFSTVAEFGDFILGEKAGPAPAERS
jgi:phosphoglycolate phosphatase/pyrophosphatase PpaX